MKLKVLKRHEVPREIAAQIRSYGRIQWPFSQGQSGQLWDYTPRTDAPIHFILMKEEVVVSHACVNWRNLEFDGRTLNVYGLSTVFTYPAFRKGGYAKQVVTEASNFMRQSPGDFALLFCSQPTSFFYLPLGWTIVEGAQVTYGADRQSAQKYEGIVMALTMTPAGTAAVDRMRTNEIYVGKDTW